MERVSKGDCEKQGNDVYKAFSIEPDIVSTQ